VRPGFLTSILFVAAGAIGCAAPRAARPGLSQEEWSRARERLAWIRSTESLRPYAVQLRIAMREPWTGRAIESRGALAVQPHLAARLVLLGPGGGTALDMWLTRDKWTFNVPAADFKRKGGTDPAAAHGLPIGFFRWWFLEPLEGRLLTTSTVGGSRTFVLRAGEGTITLKESRERGRERVVARRREEGEQEGIEWIGRGLTPHAGDRAKYVQDATGLEVEVLVEAVSTEEPDPAAFLDPDDPGVAL
jgi:hypothetical protein